MGTRLARLGRYDVIRTLASGALTDLLLGRASGMEGFQRHVAIKRLREEHAADPAVLEMFVNEARLVGALHHHNIVQVLDIGEGSGEPFFAMEYVHGVDLRKLLGLLSKRGEQLPFPHVVSIVASAAAALHHAHEQKGPDGASLGIVHRQVTPGNILVGFDGNVKIVDFGMAKAAIKRSETGIGVLRGSAPYMAPEQCAGQRVDRRSDVFALGIVLYELATVRRLFKGANEFLTMSAVVTAEVPRPSQYRRDVPPDLEVVMLKALARDPLARYQTAGQMAEALDKVARAVGVGASTSQLASYMKLQFGDVREPWLETLEQDPETTDVDFDGQASGLAPPPKEAVKNHALPKTIDATKSSPIRHARARTKGGTQPPPLPERSFHVTTGVESPRAKTNTDPNGDLGEEPPTDIPIPKQKTNVAAPPPPPGGTHEGEKPRGDMTAIVEPLSVIQARASTISPRGRRRFVFWGAIVLAAVAAIVLAIVLWPASDLSPTPVAEAPAPAPLPAPEATEAPAKSALDMTAREYEAAHGIDAGAELDAPAPLDAATAAAEEPEVVAEPATPPPEEHTPSAEPAKPASVVAEGKATKPAVRPASKPIKRTTKPAAKRTAPATPVKKAAPKKQKPKWNPDDLFLGG